MPTLKNKGKIKMSLQDRAASNVNDTGTCQEIDTPLTHPGSRTVLRDLIVMREAHGPESAIGHHCSNIVELIQMPNPPAFQLKKQMEGLQRAMRDVQ